MYIYVCVCVCVCVCVYACVCVSVCYSVLCKRTVNIIFERVRVYWFAHC